MSVAETIEAPKYRSSEELAMRALIVPKLRAMFPGARIIHELPLRYSSNRIDLAAIGASEIVSVEIKSSRDVADRLEAQLRAFEPISSRMICALAPQWNEELPQIEKKGRGYTAYIRQYTETQAIINRVGRFAQHAVEVWTVDVDKGSIEPTTAAYLGRRPHLSQMLDMLHNIELERIATAHRVSVGKRSTHEFMVSQCWELMTGKEIVTAVCRALRSRHGFGAESDPPAT